MSSRPNTRSRSPLTSRLISSVTVLPITSMETLNAAFESACQAVKQSQPDPMTVLRLYGLYKQATVGDAPSAPPEGLIAQQKYKAWKEWEGLTKEQAKEMYVEVAGQGTGEKTMGNTVSRFTIESTELNPQAQSSSDVDTLCAQIRQGDLDLPLLERLSPNIQDSEGLTPLHHACDSGQLPIVSTLLHTFSADTNLQDLAGMTPLHYAVLLEDRDIILELLRMENIDREVRDQEGQTAVELASEEIREFIEGVTGKRQS